MGPTMKEESRDQDVHKGATEDDDPSATTNAPDWTTTGCRTTTWQLRRMRLARAKTARRDDSRLKSAVRPRCQLTAATSGMTSIPTRSNATFRR